MKGEIDKSTIIYGDLNILLSVIYRIIRQTVSKDTEKLNYAINQLDIIDIYVEYSTW